jgi:predicted phage terminase large subunit-like protein
MRALLECTVPQADFWDLKGRYTAFIGGIGSGKTFAGAVKVLTMPRDTAGLIVAPTYNILRSSTLEVLQEVAGSRILSFNQSRMVMSLTGNRKVWLRSASDPNSFRGINANWLWFDEAAFAKWQAWLVSIQRARRSPGVIWITTTPRGKKHWLYKKLIQPGKMPYIPAHTASNHFNVDGFAEAVAGFGSTAWQRQELGGEFVDEGGGLFERNWFPLVTAIPLGQRLSCRAWDFAATAGAGDWTVGLRMHRVSVNMSTDNRGRVKRKQFYFVDDIKRGQWGPADVDRRLIEAAEEDGKKTTVIVEREPGSAGKRANHYIKNSLKGYRVVEEQTSGSKLIRAMPAAKAAARGDISVVDDWWTTAFLDELEEFTGNKATEADEGQKKEEIDDQVDALAHAINWQERSQSVAVS